MSLVSLELLPRGNAGWTSRLLPIGRAITVVLGPNGAGKTPIVRSLAYALGHPVTLPRLVHKKCRAVAVGLTFDGATFKIERSLAESGLDVIVTDEEGKTIAFASEREFSEWVLPKLGIALRHLTGKSGDQVSPYMSVVGPMFLVDQDTGWTAPYVPLETHQFVRDQREEVCRWLLDVPARHRAIDKSQFEEAKARLAAIQEQISFKRRGLEALQRELGQDRSADAVSRLEGRRVVLEDALSRAESALEAMSQTESSLDVRIREAVQQQEEFRRRLSNARRRKAQLAEVQAEIGAELGALEQNEVASEVFRTLCGNQSCQFFRRTEETYGRRVLYLKDQLKDFESSSGETERELETLREQLKSADLDVRRAVDQKRASLTQEGGGNAVVLVQAASRELADVHVRLDRLERIDRERDQLERLIDLEARVKEEADELRPTARGRRNTARVLDARRNLAVATSEWLLTLGTPNIADKVEYDDHLSLTIGGERFSTKSSYSGSTRTRLILAYHAAMIEVSLSMNGVHPHVLVLDAPRQHELAAEDLRSYIEKFHRLSTGRDTRVQLILSATDPEVVPEGRVDRVWEPTFYFEGNRRYLGPVG